MPNLNYPEGGVPNEQVKVNALGSLVPYLAPTSVDAQVTSLLQNKVINKIFGTRPSKDDAALITLLFGRTPEFFPTVEASWYEMPDQRMSIIPDDGTSPAGTQLTAATPAVPNGYATANMPVATASFKAAGINRRIYWGNGTGGAVIVGKTPAAGANPATLQLKSLGAGAGIPAIIQGDIVTLSAEIRADGERRIVNHTRFNTLKRTNFITTIMNTREYARKAWLSMQNGGTTDFLSQEMQQLIYFTKTDAMIEMLIGVKGIQENDNGMPTETTDGIITQWINAGFSPIPATVATMTDVFEDVLHNTAHQSSGTKLVLAPQRVITELSKQYKSDGTRYTPNDMVARLDLDSVSVGGTRAVFMPCDLIGNENYLNRPGRMLVIDPECIHQAGMKGMPYMDLNGMVRKRLLSFTDERGSRDDLFTTPIEMTFAPMLKAPERCSIVDVAGF